MTIARNTLLSISALYMTCAFSLTATAAPSAYRIAPGETVEVNIASIPDHNLRAVVQTDGTIALAEVGSIMVAGLTPAEMQARLEAVLPTNLFRARGKDGAIVTYIIMPGDITSSVVAYRPIYVTGAVFAPGEFPYRPMMTARQAIAVAGGPSLIRKLSSQSGGDPVDLQRDYQSLWTEYLKAHFHHERIIAEIKGVAEIDLRAPTGMPLPQALATTIGDTETEALKLALEDGRKEQAYLEATAKASEEQIATLSEREKVESAAEKNDRQDLEKVQQLLKNGNQTNDRVAEIRRSLLLTQSSRLDTLVELMRERTRRSDTERQIEQRANQRRAKLLDDLRDTNVSLADLEVKLQATGAKLQVHDIGTQVEPPMAEMSKPQMSIIRLVENQWHELPSMMEFELLPGDIVEVLSGVKSNQDSARIPSSQDEPATVMRGNSKISVN